MRTSLVVSNSAIYGPGLRTVIWTQGCSIRCPGCWNDKLWDFKGGSENTVEELVKKALQSGDSGITLLGGEPLDQPVATRKLIEACHEQGLDIMLYTGFEESELNKCQLDCVKSADIVVIGRYVDELRSEHLLWRGSSNQRIIWNMEIPQNLNLADRRQVEIRFDNTGKVNILGYPSESMLAKFTSRFGTLKSFSKESGDV
jgi:anaerobic ribonucleoside-triphosphate reductase activating protein